MGHASITRGAFLMLGALTALMAVNALARELAGRYPLGELLVLRFGGSLVAFLLIALWGKTNHLRSRHRPVQAMRALFGVGGTLLLYAASRHLPFSDLIAISLSAPLFVTALSSPLLGERVGPCRAGLTLAGFCGVAMVAFPSTISLWSLAALGMALLNALVAITARSLARTEHPMTTGIHYALFGTLLALPIALPDWVMPTWSDLPLFLALAAAAAVAIDLNLRAFRHAPASVLAPIDFAGIALSALVGFVFWREIPTASTIVGGLVIAIAGVAQFRLAAREQHRARLAALPTT
jgi:drug/metabolite transporter (DMT)-like permease